MVYTPPANDQTYFITQYALTVGIVKVKGHLNEGFVSVVWEDSWSGRRAMFRKPDWHTTIEAAQDRVQAMKAAKLKSLRKQVAKLEATCVSSLPVEDRTALAEKPETEE
jgi:hypothetical protein